MKIEDELCPVCGYYCSGNGGIGCVDKPALLKAFNKEKPMDDYVDVLIDFDGVIHSYVKSGWEGADVISDPPIDGAIQFIRNCIDSDLKVGIYSSRNHQNGGINAMISWLDHHGLEKQYFRHPQLQFPLRKPPHKLIIDDRAFAFEGNFPTIDFIKNFQPWNKR